MKTKRMDINDKIGTREEQLSINQAKDMGIDIDSIDEFKNQGRDNDYNPQE